MAVASDLPEIENRQQYGHEVNSYLYDDHWRPIGLFAPPNHDVIDTYNQISPYMRDAIISVEDKRFWTDPGVDIRGIGRALVADVTGGATAGGVDDRAAVRQERARRGGQPHDLREAARGGARIPPHARVDQAEDPHAVPELDLLRQRRLRRRVGRARVFRRQVGLQPAWRVRRPAAPAVRLDARALSGRAARRNGRQPVGIQPGGLQASRDGEAQPGAAGHAPAGLHQPHAVPAGHSRAAAHRERHRATTGAARRRRTSRAGCVRRSWPRWAGAGCRPTWPRSAPTTAASRSARRSTCRCSRQPSRRSPMSLPSGPGEPTASLVAIDNRTGQVRAMVGGPLVDGQQDYSQYPFNLATEGAAPARLGVQAVHARGRAPARVHARLGDRLKAAEPDRPQQRRQGALPGQELRQRVLGPDHARRRDRRLGQQRLHPGRPRRSAPSAIANMARRWGSARRSPTTTR